MLSSCINKYQSSYIVAFVVGNLYNGGRPIEMFASAGICNLEHVYLLFDSPPPTPTSSEKKTKPFRPSPRSSSFKQNSICLCVHQFARKTVLLETDPQGTR